MFYRLFSAAYGFTGTNLPDSVPILSLTLPICTAGTLEIPEIRSKAYNWFFVLGNDFIFHSLYIFRFFDLQTF